LCASLLQNGNMSARTVAKLAAAVLFSATTNAAEDARTTVALTVAVKGTKLHLDISDLAMRVAATHSRLSGLLDQFEAVADTLSPNDRAACRRSLAKAAGRIHEAATFCAAATRHFDRGRAAHKDVETGKSAGRFVARFKLMIVERSYVGGLDATGTGGLVAHGAEVDLAGVADLLAAKSD
jgi:hypothetical protein